MTFAVVRSSGASVGGHPLLGARGARAARSLLVLSAVAFIALLTVVFVPAAVASQPRSNYALTVLVNDSRTPEVAIVLQLDEITGNTSYPYWAAVMTANLSLGPQLAWTEDGAPGGYKTWTHTNVSGTTYFNATAFVAPAVRQNMTQNPGDLVFATITAVVTYTDNLGASPRSIYRTVSFALNYEAPVQTTSLLPAALLGVGGAGAIGVGLFVVRRARLEELYLMHDSGMLIRHWSRRQQGTHDSDILSGMLIVLQEFVRDTWKSHQAEDAPLEQLRFGGQRVVLARGQHAVLAAVVEGRYLNGLPRKLQSAVQEFESQSASVLADWNGNVDVFPQVDAIARRFLGSRGRAST